MICRPCRSGGFRHSECRGGTWCDCAHKPRQAERYDGLGPWGMPVITFGSAVRPDLLPVTLTREMIAIRIEAKLRHDRGERWELT